MTGLQEAMRRGAAVALVAIAGLLTPTNPAQAEPYSGTMDDWLAAACDQGRLFDGTHIFPNAMQQAACQSSVNHAMILIGRWDSNPTMYNDLTNVHTRYYTSGMRTDGTPFAFAVVAAESDSGSIAALQPLAKFGLPLMKN